MQLNSLAVVAALTKALNIFPLRSEQARLQTQLRRPAGTASRVNERNISMGHRWNQSKRRNGSTRRRTRHSVTPSTTITKWMTLALNPGRQPADGLELKQYSSEVALLMYGKIKLLERFVCSHSGEYSAVTAHCTNWTQNKFRIQPYLKPYWRDAGSSWAIR